MQKRTWPIVMAFVVGWILAPLADPPTITDPADVVAVSSDATGHSTTHSQLAARSSVDLRNAFHSWK